MEKKNKEELINSAIKFYNSKLYSKSIEECKRALAIDNNYVRGHHGIARSLVGLNKYKEALEEYKVIIYQEENDSEIYKQRADVHYALKDYVSASNDYGRAITLNLKNKEAVKMKAKANAFV